MERNNIVIYQWKTAMVLIGLLVVLAADETKTIEKNGAEDVTLLSLTEAWDSLDFSKDFLFVPGSAVQVDEDRIVALYRNWRNGVYALAMFTADCDPEGCDLGDLIAYSVIDPQGEPYDDEFQVEEAGIFPVNQFFNSGQGGSYT
jgi:hypothetical protein